MNSPERKGLEPRGEGQVAESCRRTYTPAHMTKLTIRWVIKDRLARGARPGFSGRRAVQVSQSSVDAWLRRVKTRYGIRSIICLLDENHLRFYSRIPGGLISYYRKRGLKVEFVRVRNRRNFSEAQLEKVRIAYRRFANTAVLVHCSAGRGRTGKAVAHIKACFHSR
jgi:rhodanese/phosphatase family protein